MASHLPRSQSLCSEIGIRVRSWGVGTAAQIIGFPSVLHLVLLACPLVFLLSPYLSRPTTTDSSVEPSACFLLCSAAACGSLWCLVEERMLNFV